MATLKKQADGMPVSRPTTEEIAQRAVRDFPGAG